MAARTSRRGRRWRRSCRVRRAGAGRDPLRLPLDGNQAGGRSGGVSIHAGDDRRDVLVRGGDRRGRGRRARGRRPAWGWSSRRITRTSSRPRRTPASACSSSASRTPASSSPPVCSHGPASWSWSRRHRLACRSTRARSSASGLGMSSPTRTTCWAAASACSMPRSIGSSVPPTGASSFGSGGPMAAPTWRSRPTL